jgi:hypothetical protein
MSMAETTQQPTIDLHKKSISNTATTREKNNDGYIGLESKNHPVLSMSPSLLVHPQSACS